MSVLTNISGSVIDNTLSFDLFPSINNGEFTISFGGNAEKTIEVIDVMGKIVYSQKFNTEKLPLNLNLSSGAYYAKIVSGDKVGVKKFIVQ